MFIVFSQIAKVSKHKNTSDFKLKITLFHLKLVKGLIKESHLPSLGGNEVRGAIMRLTWVKFTKKYSFNSGISSYKNYNH